TVVHHGPRTAPATADLGRRGLDQQLELAAVLARGENDEAGQVNDGLRAATGSVSTHWGLQRSVAWSLWIMRPQPLLSHHHPSMACRDALPPSWRRAHLVDLHPKAFGQDRIQMVGVRAEELASGPRRGSQLEEHVIVCTIGGTATDTAAQSLAHGPGPSISLGVHSHPTTASLVVTRPRTLPGRFSGVRLGRGEADGRRVLGVVPDLNVDRPQIDGGGERITGARVARVARIGAAADLHP